MRDKASLRRHYRQLRRTTPAIHEAIYGAALSFVRRTTTETSVVGLYWPLANEVDLRPLRTQLPNPMALPQADGKGCLQYNAGVAKTLKRMAAVFPRQVTAATFKQTRSACCSCQPLPWIHLGSALAMAGGTTTDFAQTLSGRTFPRGLCCRRTAFDPPHCRGMPGMCPSTVGLLNRGLARC